MEQIQELTGYLTHPAAIMLTHVFIILILLLLWWERSRERTRVAQELEDMRKLNEQAVLEIRRLRNAARGEWEEPL